MARVLAVVVTYNNKAMLERLLADLAGQTHKDLGVLVVDNASADGTAALFSAPRPGVEYVRLAENTGSAGGYHEGFRRARGAADYIMTLDDDVSPAPDCAAALVAGFEALARGAKVGAVRAVGAKHPVSHPTELKIAPWRGTLFSAAAVEAAGLPDPSYFIYGEDLEYSLRLRRAGFQFSWIPAALCPERRREKTTGTLLGREVSLYPSPFRLYYAFRNEVAIYVRYREFWSLTRTLLYALKASVYLAVREGAAGRPKRRAILDGLRDGFSGRSGKNLDYPAA